MTYEDDADCADAMDRFWNLCINCHSASAICRCKDLRVTLQRKPDHGDVLEVDQRRTAGILFRQAVRDIYNEKQFKLVGQSGS